MQEHNNAQLLMIHAVLLAFLPMFARAQFEHQHHRDVVLATADKILYQPTAMPDRIILTLNGDPRTTQTINWRTSVEVPLGLAQIAKAQAGPDFSENARQFEATTQALKTNLNTAHYHSVLFSELEPGTIYAYRAGDGVNWSEWFHFRTASEAPERFSFVYFGDAQNNVRSMWSRVIREAHRDAPKAAFMLHAGDLVNRAESDAEWGEWFGAGGWLNAMTPSVAIPGNHEHVKQSDGRRKLSHHWRKVFTFPENGPRGLEETCFTMTYHNLRIVGLNSNELHEEQALWLDGVLARNESEWVICTFHHPVFSTGKDRDNPGLRALWKPIFDKYKVDLVLQGHDHTYGRTGLNVPTASTRTGTDKKTTAMADHHDVSVTVGNNNTPVGVTKVDEAFGTVYVVSVSGPKMYNNTRHPYMKRIAEDTQLYQVIHIDDDRLKFEARTAIGELYDAFELHKRDPVNKLVELKPEIPQRLRPRKEIKASTEQMQPTGQKRLVMVKPDLMLYGAGENVDTIGVWETEKPEDTLIFVSAKDNQTVEVWKYPFKDNEQTPMKRPEWSNGAVNGIAVDQDNDLLYVTVGEEPSSAFVYSLPGLEKKMQFVNRSRDLFGEPNVCLLKRPGKGTLAYVTSDRQISIHKTATGEQIDLFDSPTDVETVYGDQYYQCVYVPDENDRTGVNVYTPELKPFRKNDSNHFGTGVFELDAEGVWVYYLAGHGNPDDGRGYIIVSDQTEPLTEFEFFDRQTWNHLGTLKIEGVGNTDGICSSQRPLPGYPMGFFAAIHDDQALAIVKWETVLAALHLPVN